MGAAGQVPLATRIEQPPLGRLTMLVERVTTPPTQVFEYIHRTVIPTHEKSPAGVGVDQPAGLSRTVLPGGGQPWAPCGDSGVGPSGLISSIET